MSLVEMRPLLETAQRGGHGMGAFNVIGLEHAQAIVMAAEMERSPVILQVSQNAVAWHGGLGAIGVVCADLAEHASVPVGLHLDHATTWELCAEALALGFGSVMFDASDAPLEDNIARTADVAQRVHATGHWLEAELGVVGGKDGAVSSESGNTDPELARRYVAETGVDALAVAVGTSHYMVETSATIDLDLLVRLRAALDVPLVLHGASGVGDDALREAVAHGITKVNTATQINTAFTAAVREALDADPALVDPRRYLGAGRDAAVAAVRQRLRVIGSTGRA